MTAPSPRGGGGLEVDSVTWPMMGQSPIKPRSPEAENCSGWWTHGCMCGDSDLSRLSRERAPRPEPSPTSPYM